MPLSTPRARAVLFAGLIYDLQQRFPFSATSWWRSLARNKRVGGVPASYHLNGCATDIIPEPEVDRAALVAAAFAMGLEAYDEGDHIHIEYDWRKVEGHGAV